MFIREKGTETGLLGGNKGFTLIEMAIVLIIIGIIIGAVVKGKDLIRSAEQKKIYTKYVSAWRLAYLNFYDRTGKVLGDKSDPSNGQADDPTCLQLVDGDTATPPAYYGLSQIGLETPTTNTSDSCTYKYSDSEGNGHNISVTFKWDDTAGAKYNYMLISVIPNELGMALDTMIDGEADGTAGDFLCYKDDDTGLATAWLGADAPNPEDDVCVRWKMQF